MEKQDKKALVVFSGGMDSTTCVYWALKNYKEVETLSFYYGSKHNEQEYKYALKTCEKLGLKNTRISLDFVNKYFKSDLLQSGGDIPEGYYTAENMKSTVVPFRNGIMLSIAAGFAESQNCQVLVIGNHSGDHCFTKDTKILTPSGLKTYEDLNVGEDIYSFDIENNKICLDKITNKVQVKKVPTIVNIETDCGNIQLTDDHKVYKLKLGDFHNCYGYTKSIEKVEVNQLNVDDYLIQPTGLIKEDVASVNGVIDLLPIVQDLIKKYTPEPNLYEEDGKIWICQERLKDTQAIDRYINKESFLCLLAWYIAEGWSKNDCYDRHNKDGSKYVATFAQSLKANLEKVDLIMELANDCKLPFKYEFSKTLHNNIPKEVTFRVTNVSGLLMQDCGHCAQNKQIPEWAFNLLLQNKELREKFIYNIGLADGFNTEKDVKGYCSKSPRLTEQMITLIQLSGYHYNITQHPQSSVNYINYAKKGNKQALISLGDAKFTKIKNITVEEYNDYVYDITVEKNHNFFGGDYGQLLISNCIYYDCRPEFTESMKEAIKLGTVQGIEMVAPFCNVSKTDIAKIGQELGVDFSLTYSCYKGEEKHCGKCGTCTERIEAFHDAGVPDPTEYEELTNV